MKFYRYFSSKSLPSSSISCVHNLLLEKLPIKQKTIDSIIFFHGEKLIKIPSDRLIKNCETCRNFNIVLSPITNLTHILRQHSTILKHKICLLQEMGVPSINLGLISRISKNMTISANDFKMKANIPMNQNIMINLISYIKKEESNLPPLKLLDESLPLIMHYEQCVLHYITFKFGKCNTTYNQGKKYMSIRMMIQMLKLFEEDIGIDHEYLKNHLLMLESCPDNAKKVIQSLKDITIDPVLLGNILKKKREILSYDPKNIKKILESIKKYELPVTAVNDCLEVLKVKHNVFEDSMQYLLSVPDIKVWTKDSHILHCITHKEKVKRRINILSQAGLIKWAHIKIFTSSEKRAYQEGFIFTKKQMHIKYILCKELGSDKEHLINSVMKHPYWNRIAYVDIDNTLNHLKETFTKEDICNNIQLILYPWSLIMKQLEEIKKFDSYNRNNNLTPSQCLALCLYLIEKDNHFTGDGVWNVDKIKTRQKEEILLEGNILNPINETMDFLNEEQFCMINQHMRYSDMES